MQIIQIKIFHNQKINSKRKWTPLEDDEDYEDDYDDYDDNYDEYDDDYQKYINK